MRRIVVLLGSLALSLLPVSARAYQLPVPSVGPIAQPDWAPVADDGWRLVFAEEFSAPQLDTTKWHSELPWGRWNPPELQYYAKDALELKNGILRLRAERRDMGGRTYTSGVISSHGLFFTAVWLHRDARPDSQRHWPMDCVLVAARKPKGSAGD